ncbi:MAG: 5-formyltetrahydrofolate cyclo-ligase [Treponema sp.]|nr:5-formyltetrahydrofolate cyclo-ligase [Treponema sp.]
MRQRMRNLKPSSAETYSAGVVACGIGEFPCWKQHETVLLFLSMKYEIDTGPLLERALYEGKDVFAPKIINDKLQFFQIFEHDRTGRWEAGAFGIREPASRKALSPRHFPCLIITPGLAFDRNGNRLGRGKGYYDRFFAELDAQNLPYFSVGFCMPSQIVDRVPAKPWDKKMDAVLDVSRL